MGWNSWITIRYAEEISVYSEAKDIPRAVANLLYCKHTKCRWVALQSFDGAASEQGV